MEHGKILQRLLENLEEILQKCVNYENLGVRLEKKNWKQNWKSSKKLGNCIEDAGNNFLKPDFTN